MIKNKLNLLLGLAASGLIGCSAEEAPESYTIDIGLDTQVDGVGGAKSLRAASPVGHLVTTGPGRWKVELSQLRLADGDPELSIPWNLRGTIAVTPLNGSPAIGGSGNILVEGVAAGDFDGDDPSHAAWTQVNGEPVVTGNDVEFEVACEATECRVCYDPATEFENCIPLNGPLFKIDATAYFLDIPSEYGTAVTYLQAMVAMLAPYWGGVVTYNETAMQCVLQNKIQNSLANLEAPADMIVFVKDHTTGAVKNLGSPVLAADALWSGDLVLTMVPDGAGVTRDFSLGFAYGGDCDENSLDIDDCEGFWEKDEALKVTYDNVNCGL